MAIRVLLAKIGIDGHDRGLRLIGHSLREAGMEVVYLGAWQTPEDVTAAAIQEGADIIGISTLGGDEVLVPRLMTRLREKEVNTPVILGGLIRKEYEDMLKKEGVAKIYRAGSDVKLIIDDIKALVGKKG